MDASERFFQIRQSGWPETAGEIPLEALHSCCLSVAVVIVAEQVGEAMDEQALDLLEFALGSSSRHRLHGDDDVPQQRRNRRLPGEHFADLLGSDLGKGEDIRRAVDLPPLTVELGDERIIAQEDREIGLSEP